MLPPHSSNSLHNFSDIFDYLEVRRADAVELLAQLRSFFRITSEINADLSKKSQLQHFYLTNLTDHDQNISESLNALADHFDEFGKSVSKFSTECRDLIHKPLKQFVRSYRLSTIKILYQIRRQQCQLGTEVRKAQLLHKNPQVETSEALNEKFVIQQDKCNDLLYKTQQQIDQLVNEFKRLELDRIHRVKSLLWTFHQLLLATWTSQHAIGADGNLAEFKNEILAIDPMTSLSEIDRHYHPVTLEAVQLLPRRNAQRFWLRTFIRELFIL